MLISIKKLTSSRLFVQSIIIMKTIDKNYQSIAFNFRDLSYLLAIAEYQHFGKAAAACHVSQPTLSMQIKKLEESLGVLLIERINKKCIITPLGWEIIERAKRIHLEIGGILDIASNAKQPFHGDMFLGIIPTLAPYLLPYLVPITKKHYPNLNIFYIEEKTATLRELLYNGKLDAAILALPLNEPQWEIASLFIEPFLLALATQHPLAKKTSVTLEALSSESLLLLEEGHCMHDQTLAFCHKTGLKERQDFYGTTLETLRHLVIAEMGITLMPLLATRSDLSGIQYLPITPAPAAPERELVLCWRKTSGRSKQLALISQILHQELKIFTQASSTK